MNHKYPFLIRTKTQEKIIINKPVFRIGKERSYVDYFIFDNNAVSRSHADFIIKNGACYIIDRNSTNRTYLNGVAIEPENEVLLNDGIKFRLANEEFVYYANL